MHSDVAFVTLYRMGKQYRPDETICLVNGFSFVDHLFKNHKHFFLNISNTSEEEIANIKKEIIKLKNELKPFKTIYLSTISLTDDFFNIVPLLDERFIVGGPAIEFLNDEKISKLTGAKFIKTTFETYLGVPTQNQFNEYWNDYFDKDTVFGYAITDATVCPYKCAFCTYNTTEKVNRDLESMLIKVTERKTLKFIMLTAPLQSPSNISIIRKLYDRIQKSNTYIWAFVRSEEKVIEEIKKFDDLSNIEFSNGLEYFSNSCLERVNKTEKVENAIELAKTILDRNGIISFSCLSMSPQFDEHELDESIKNFKIFNSLYTDYNGLLFRSAGNVYTFNEEDKIKKICKNYLKYSFPEYMDDNIMYISDYDSSIDEAFNFIFDKYLKNIISRSFLKRTRLNKTFIAKF